MASLGAQQGCAEILFTLGAALLAGTHLSSSSLTEQLHELCTSLLSQRAIVVPMCVYTARGKGAVAIRALRDLGWHQLQGCVCVLVDQPEQAGPGGSPGAVGAGLKGPKHHLQGCVHAQATSPSSCTRRPARSCGRWATSPRWSMRPTRLAQSCGRQASCPTSMLGPWAWQRWPRSPRSSAMHLSTPCWHPLCSSWIQLTSPPAEGRVIDAPCFRARLHVELGQRSSEMKQDEWSLMMLW